MRLNDRFGLYRARRAALAAGFRELSQNPDRPWPDSKHWDLSARLAIAQGHLLRLDLDETPSKRILDLGTGCGYFPYLCQRYGHEVIGLDQESWEIGPAICDILGVRLVAHDIKAFEPLPDLGAPFDLVTALLFWFNTRESPKDVQDDTWGAAEWEFFLDDLSRRLTEDGQVYLTLGNTTSDGPLNSEADAYLRSRGARIVDATIQLDRKTILRHPGIGR